MHLLRKAGLGAGVAGVAAVAGIVAGFACTSLASLNLSSASGPAGSNVTISGSSFNSVAAGKYTPVAIHFDGATGPILATVNPDASGALPATPLTIPSDVQPGYYAIVAVQTSIPGGTPAFGTPARVSFQVTGAGSAPQNAPSATSPISVSSTSNGLGAGTIGLLVALGVGGLLLFGMGAATFVGNSRRVPAASKVKK